MFIAHDHQSTQDILPWPRNFLDSTFIRARSQWAFNLDPMVELLNESLFKEAKQISVEVTFKSWLKKTLCLTHNLLMFLGWDQHPWKWAQLHKS
jgi:hypothetical protein